MIGHFGPFRLGASWKGVAVATEWFAQIWMEVPVIKQVPFFLPGQGDKDDI